MYVTTWPISKRGNKWEMLSYEAWTDGRTAVCHKPVFWRAYKNEWPISWNYEYIIFGQIIFQNFHQFKAFVGLSDASYDNISHLFPLLLIGHVVTYIVLKKGGASERCDFSQFGKRQFSYLNTGTCFSVSSDDKLVLFLFPGIPTGDPAIVAFYDKRIYKQLRLKEYPALLVCRHCFLT
jgi:hypothetical protein